MLGETANIRSNAIPYFQIFIIFDKVPYYEKGGSFKRYDVITPHNLEKYLALSKDDPSVFFHTPDKTLVVLVKLKEKALNYRFIDDKDYAKFYLSVIDDEDLLTYATQVSDPFEDSVIYNDYEDFIQRTYHITVGKLKKIITRQLKWRKFMEIDSTAKNMYKKLLMLYQYKNWKTCKGFFKILYAKWICYQHNP